MRIGAFRDENAQNSHPKVEIPRLSVLRDFDAIWAIHASAQIAKGEWHDSRRCLNYVQL